MRPLPVALGLALALGLSGPLHAEEAPFLVLASTTSTQASGLYDALLPAFRRETGIEVRVVAVGTGQALRLAERGDADALLVHAPAAERAFVEAGHGLARHEVMWNDFVIVGPAEDPARLRGSTDVGAALRRIAEAEAPFLSRGDDSGTHKKELSLWREARLDPATFAGSWYREAGSGMGRTLNTANGMGSYTLTDRGTWLAFRNRSQLQLLVEGDPALRNPYGAIVVNPARHPHVKHELAQRFVDWLLSPAGQRRIGEFRVQGQPLFHPLRAGAPAERGAAAPPQPRVSSSWAPRVRSGMATPIGQLPRQGALQPAQAEASRASFA